MRYPTAGEAIIIIGILLAAWSLYKAHHAKNALSIFDLITENGRISKQACVFLGTWAAMTYVFIGLYLTGKMTEGLYTAYGAVCFAPMIAKMFSSNSSTVATSSTTQTVEITK